MSDHVMESEGQQSEGPWQAGWLWSLVAALVAAVLARWLGEVSIPAAVLLGLMVFVVYSVLLAQFWEAPASGDHDNGHGHGHDDHGHGHADHAHGAHGHDDHSHAPVAVMAAPAPMAAVAPAAEMTPVAPLASVAPIALVAPMATDAGMVETAPVEGIASATAAAKPQALTAPRNGKADALQEIEGIGPGLEKLCHDLGIFHFDQIAGWKAAEIAWMDGNLKGFKGRVSRDKWVAQARLIVAEGIDAFRLRAKSNDY